MLVALASPSLIAGVVLAMTTRYVRETCEGSECETGGVIIVRAFGACDVLGGKVLT